jgi:molecular chaperone DnaK
VEIHVLQGEREMARDNRTLGKFTLTGIPPAPRGVPQIEVSFDIDANGILNVNAKDTATGKQQAITITSSSGLNEEEIEQMVRDAEKHGEEDKAKKQTVENRNKLDQLAYASEKLIKENKDKIPGEMVKEVEEAVNRAREAVKSEDDQRIRDEIEKLNAVTTKLSTELYKHAGAQPGQEAPGQEGPQANAGAGAAGSAETAEEGEVIDAEYEDVDSGKK